MSHQQPTSSRARAELVEIAARFFRPGEIVTHADDRWLQRALVDGDLSLLILDIWSDEDEQGDDDTVGVVAEGFTALQVRPLTNSLLLRTLSDATPDFWRSVTPTLAKRGTELANRWLEEYEPDYQPVSQFEVTEPKARRTFTFLALIPISPTQAGALLLDPDELCAMKRATLREEIPSKLRQAFRFGELVPVDTVGASNYQLKVSTPFAPLEPAEAESPDPRLEQKRKLPDDFVRIYGDVREHSLFRDMKAVYDHAAKFLPEESQGIYHTGVEFGDHDVLISALESSARHMLRAYHRTFGPKVMLEGAPDIQLGRLQIVVYAADDAGQTGAEEEAKNLLQWPFRFRDSGLPDAALAYKRESGWDFAPGDAGVWVLCVMPSTGCGGEDRWFYDCNILGFLVLYDYQGAYKLEHLWTAECARRKGVARKIVEHARERFPIKGVSQILTRAGKAFLESVWPEVLTERRSSVFPSEVESAAESDAEWE